MNTPLNDSNQQHASRWPKKKNEIFEHLIILENNQKRPSISILTIINRLDSSIHLLRQMPFNDQFSWQQ